MKLSALFNRIRSVPYARTESDGSYYFERRGNTLYLFFQESVEKKDWRNNFDFPAKPYRDMEIKWYVHRGFLRVWKEIKERVKEQIADETVKKIVVAGYSHGAAIAVLCYEFCVFHRPSAAVVGYGFGCPRVLFGFPPKEIRDRFCNFYVIRNSSDIVTHLPPKCFGYRHVGNILHIGLNSRYGLIKSHLAENYIHELQNM